MPRLTIVTIGATGTDSVEEPMLFAGKPTPTGSSVNLRPLGPEHVDDLLVALPDREVLRLTGNPHQI